MDIKSILVGLDFDGETRRPTEGALAAARQACWLAERTGAAVQFLHSKHWNPEDGPPPSSEDIELSELTEVVRSHGGQEPDLTFSDEPAWIALTHCVLAERKDLVVVAKRNRRRKDDRRLGSTSMKIVRKCPSPVWVVRPEHRLRHRSILAGTDLSTVGDRAVEFGAFLASLEGCALLVVHAWQMPLELQMSASRLGDVEFASRKKTIVRGAGEHIRRLTAAFPAIDANVSMVVAQDSPSHAILEVVRREDPDLVVLGTISRGGVAGVLVGNTAEKLIYELDCSLLTVKPDDFVCPLQ